VFPPPQRFFYSTVLSLRSQNCQIRPEETFIGLFLDIDTKWEISRPLQELVDDGVDLRGLVVIYRERQPGKRRVLGNISEIINGIVRLAEAADDGVQEVPLDRVQLEVSKTSFSRCLQTLLDAEYDRFEELRRSKESNVITGPAMDRSPRTSWSRRPGAWQ
jgi:hypothetical protein